MNQRLYQRTLLGTPQPLHSLCPYPAVVIHEANTEYLIKIKLQVIFKELGQPPDHLPPPFNIDIGPVFDENLFLFP
jgi:hypothetical protein